jgi:hypothetical protein
MCSAVRKRGRPRAVFRNESFNVPDRLIVCLSESDSDFAWAFIAASLLFTLENGSPKLKRTARKSIAQLKRTHRGSAIAPWVIEQEFLERFIERYAPDWNWRHYIDDGKQRYWKIPADMVAQGIQPGKILIGHPVSQRDRRLSRDDAIAQEQAEIARHDEAWRNRFVAPDQPDVGMLNELRRIMPTDPASWPTLRELKMATAIGERSLEQMIAALQPAKVEIVRVARRRRFAERGAWPKRFAPRIVVGLLKEFRRLLSLAPDISEETRKRMLDLTAGMIRSLAAKSSRYR